MISGSLPLGIIPCGTDNGISKGLRMTDLDSCLDAILMNHIVPLNILRVSFTSEPLNLSCMSSPPPPLSPISRNKKSRTKIKKKMKSSDEEKSSSSSSSSSNDSASSEDDEEHQTSKRKKRNDVQKISVETSSDGLRYYVLSLCAGGFGLLGDIAAEADNLRSNPFCKCCRYEYLAVRNLCCCPGSRFAKIIWIKPGGKTLDDPRDCESYSGDWANVGFGNCHGALPGERKNYNGSKTMLWIHRASRFRVPLFSGLDIVCRALCRFVCSCFQTWAETIETPAFELHVSSNSCTVSDAIVLNVDGMPIVGTGPIRVEILPKKITVFSSSKEVEMFPLTPDTATYELGRV